MKLWIIYKDGLVFSKAIAELLQEFLENYIDVSVGKASKIEPSFIVEEEFDYLIIGDCVSELEPSVEIQSWVTKYRKISEGDNLNLKVLSGFLITLNEISTNTHWLEFIQKNIITETIYPPILRLKLDNTNLASDTCVNAIVKEYSNKIIEFILNTTDM
jgi:hypothetical protein